MTDKKGTRCPLDALGRELRLGTRVRHVADPARPLGDIVQVRETDALVATGDSRYAVVATGHLIAMTEAPRGGARAPVQVTLPDGRRGRPVKIEGQVASAWYVVPGDPGLIEGPYTTDELASGPGAES